MNYLGFEERADGGSSEPSPAERGKRARKRNAIPCGERARAPRLSAPFPASRIAFFLPNRLLQV